MIHYATKDIISHTSRRIYARRGQEVEVYNIEHDPVMCCRVGTEMFPCHKDKLQDEPVYTAEQAKKEANSPIKTPKTMSRVEKLQLEYLNSLKK